MLLFTSADLKLSRKVSTCVHTGGWSVYMCNLTIGRFLR
jgi:hypothetical protein